MKFQLGVMLATVLTCGAAVADEVKITPQTDGPLWRAYYGGNEADILLGTDVGHMNITCDENMYLEKGTIRFKVPATGLRKQAENVSATVNGAPALAFLTSDYLTVRVSPFDLQAKERKGEASAFVDLLTGWRRGESLNIKLSNGFEYRVVSPTFSSERSSEYDRFVNQCSRYSTY